MKFNHSHFDIKIDTNSPKIKKLLSKLQNLYSQLPETKCLNCPGKDSIEADCCKVFSPPMLLIEFIQIMKLIGDSPKEDLDRLAFECFKSYLNPDYTKPCTLLKENLCSTYTGRPLGCRLFGIYSDEEYEARLKRISTSLGVEQEDIPFHKQCRNLEVDGESTFVEEEKSDEIFEKIHKIDIEVFKDRIMGEKIVMSSATYMPFDAHYLCLRIGPDNLEALAEMKINLRNEKEKHEDDKSNITNTLEYRKKDKEVQDFLAQIKNSLS